MLLSIDQRIELLKERLSEMHFWRDRQSKDLVDWTLDGESIALGEPWPDRHGVHTLTSGDVTVPREWTLDDVRIELDLGGEGLVSIRYDEETTSRWGLDPYHHRLPVERRSFTVEAAVVARQPFGVPNRDPRLARARLVWVDVAVERLALQLALVAETADVLRSHDVADSLLFAAERAVAPLAWPSATTTYLSRTVSSPRMQAIWELPSGLDDQPPPLTDQERTSIQDAGTRLTRDLLELKRLHPQQGSLALSGHAHLDVAWLWPLEETRRKAVRTYHTVVQLMDRDDDFTFNQSSAQLYAFVEEDDHDLFERIKKKVSEGRWELTGGMWVEPDMNMTTGESLARQLLYGQRYFRRVFGTPPKVCWLPDTFGFTPALPQLLAGAGIEAFFTHKLNWSETNQFPFDLFWWEGLDGSRVLAHGFNNPYGGYNSDVTPRPLAATWSNFRGKRWHDESLLSVGWGDGGGGPTEEMLDAANELQVFPMLPAVRFRRVEDFYQRIRKEVPLESLPVWVGELYLEFHRGTLTSQGRVKYLHRRAERDLLAVEVASTLAWLMGGQQPASLEHEWRILLRNQFHDILPGSSIREVNQEAEAELGGVVSRAGARIDEGLASLAATIASPGERDGLLVVNPDLTSRALRVEIEGDYDGAQRVGRTSLLAGARKIAGLETTVLFGAAPVEGLSVSEDRLENELLRVELDDRGRLTSVYDKSAGREVLEGQGNQLWAYVDKPRVFDAWDIDATYASSGEEITDVEQSSVVESGPHRAAIRVTKRFRHSRITQDVRLWSNSARLDLRTKLEWRDRRWLLKARFPVAVRSGTASFETAFGLVERPTHRNTQWDAARFEVAGHRFGFLSEPGYGVALLNDGRYGYHAHGNELGLSLLRSPVYPDPLADEGEQIFTYSLYPFAGDWVHAGLLAEADDLNRPLLVRRVRAAAEASARPLIVEGLPVALGSLKVLEEGGGALLRIYEPRGARGRIDMTVATDWDVGGQLNLLEEPVASESPSIGPFEVRSFMLKAPGGHLPRS
jgi:alpha-mannosidase